MELGINVIRGLAMDGPETADSGHSGTAMALAPLAHVLWTRIMRYDPRHPEWPDRDRFVLSNGHACILQYAMLHLTGYDLTLEDLRQFRQWGSRTPGHPEYHHTAGIEVTTGPLGQGFANAVGMAIAERWLRTTFGAEVCDHRPSSSPGTAASWRGSRTRRPPWPAIWAWGACSPFYDDNHITIDGPTELAYDDDVPGASRPTAGGCATWARWPTTSTVSRPPSARRSTSLPTGPTRSPPSSSCAATSAGPRPT